MPKLFDKNDHGVSQLVGSTNAWAYDLWKKGCNNNWMPAVIDMSPDVKQWNSGLLSEDEKLLVKRTLGLFCAGESMVANSVNDVEFKYITCGSCRQYLMRKQFEECVSSDTDILTSEGWIPASELKETHKVAEYYPETNFVKFTVPNKVHAYDYDGELYQFQSRYIDFAVTPNHRVFAQKEYTDKVIIQEAQKFSASHKQFVVSGKLNADLECEFTALDRFKIAVQADGSLSDRYDGSRVGHIPVLFNFAKKRKIDRLLGLLKDLGYQYSVNEDRRKSATGNRNCQVIINVSVPAEIKLDKSFDWVNLEAVNYIWCQKFILELSHWDGHDYRDKNTAFKGYGYDNTNIVAADKVQAIACLANIKHSRSFYDKGDYSRLHRFGFQEGDNKRHGTIVEKTKIPYTGKVYCVTVPSGLFFIRRNNKVVVTGNSLHNATVKVCCEAYNLSTQDVAEAYNNVATIKKKQRWLKSSLDSFGPDFTIDTLDGKRKFLKNFATYYLVCEGMWFFANFALIMSLGRQSKLNGLGDQISYTIRDESLHVEFGVNLLKQSQIDYPSVWTKDFKLEIEQIIRSGAELEMEYCDDILPNGVLGVNNETLKKYVKFLANFNLQSIGLNPIYDNAMENPFPWLGESQDAQSISAFFERRETNYQHAAALDDDF